jgi:hypothetical protein
MLGEYLSLELPADVFATRLFVLSQCLERKTHPPEMVLTAEFCSDIVHLCCEEQLHVGGEEKMSQTRLSILSNLFRVLTFQQVPDVGGVLLGVMYGNSPSIELHSKALGALSYQLDNHSEKLLQGIQMALLSIKESEEMEWVSSSSEPMFLMQCLVSIE